eukprot:s2253_g7.t1
MVVACALFTPHSFCTVLETMDLRDPDIARLCLPILSIEKPLTQAQSAHVHGSKVLKVPGMNVEKPLKRLRKESGQEKKLQVCAPCSRGSAFSCCHRPAGATSEQMGKREEAIKDACSLAPDARTEARSSDHLRPVHNAITIALTLVVLTLSLSQEVHGWSVLVLGGTGFRGHLTTEQLVKDGHNVTVISRGFRYWDIFQRLAPHITHWRPTGPAAQGHI